MYECFKCGALTPSRCRCAAAPTVVGDCEVCGRAIMSNEPRTGLQVMGNYWKVHLDCFRVLQRAVNNAIDKGFDRNRMRRKHHVHA